MLIFIVLIVIVLLLYFLVIKPLVPMIQLKIQFGNQCRLYYGLLIGEIFRLAMSLKKSNDVLESVKHDPKNKNIKFIVENYVSTVQIQLIDPEYYKELLQNHQNYQKINMFNLNSLNTEGLLYSTGEKWKQQRNLFSEHFEFEKLKSRIPMINETVEYHLQQHQQKSIDTFNLMLYITGDVVGKSFFGRDFNNLQGEGHLGYEITELSNTLAGMRFNKPYYLLKRILFGTNSWNIFPNNEEKALLERINKLRLNVEKYIQKRIVQHELKIDEDENQIETSYTDFLDIYIKTYLESKTTENSKITIEEIIQQFITLVHAGTDTTGSLAYFCLYYFATYPEIQEEILQEIQSIAQNGVIIDSEINKLVKLSAFINEVLRLRNPSTRPILRYATTTHYLKDLKIEKGWYVTADYELAGVSDKYFENPMEFNYKRWLQSNTIKNDNSFIFIPFSAGKRNCIGQHMAQIEAKIILSKILLRFKIELNQSVNPKWMFKFLYQLHPNNVVVLKTR